MNRRREALKKLVEARNKNYSYLITDEEAEKIEAYKSYFYKYDYEFDDEFGDEFDDELTSQKEKVAKPPEGYVDWLYNGSSAKKAERKDEKTLQYILMGLKEPDLEEVAERIYKKGISLSDEGLDILFLGIADTESPEFWDNEAIYKLMEENAMVMLDVEVISMLGKAYGKLGIPVDKLPEIGINDTSFLRGYLENLPVNKKDIIREENPEYGQYIEFYNLVERAQSELSLKHAKEEQDVLIGKTQKIAEVEGLVDKQQGQQQE